MAMITAMAMVVMGTRSADPMRRRGFFPKRSGRNWAIRALLASIVAVAGYLSTAHTLAFALHGRYPDKAYALAPWDGRITAKLAAKRLADNPENGAAPLARRAVRQDATAIDAVVALGLDAQLHGDAVRARRLFAFADKLSRRNLQAHLWAIEDSVARDDVPGALRRYDLALRTSKHAPDLLFPVLASAAIDPAIRKSLVPVLAKAPYWAPRFIDYVATNSNDAEAVGILFLQLRRHDIAVSQDASAAAIGRLLTKNAVDLAWRYYAAIRPGASRTRSRDPNFNANLSIPSAFDWAPINNGAVAATIQRGDEGGIVDFSASPGASGAVLQQQQALPEGMYQITGRSLGVDQPSASMPYWVLTCRDGRELGRVMMPSSNRNNGIFTGSYTVPANCPVQTLALVLRPSDGIVGVTGQVDRLMLEPAP